MVVRLYSLSLVDRTPAEVLCMVFDHCGLRERMRVTSTCRRWRQVAANYSKLWRDVHVSTSPNLSSTASRVLGLPLPSLFAAWQQVDSRLPNAAVFHTVALDGLLARNKTRTVNLFISVLTRARSKYLADLRSVLVKNADRLAQVSILFKDLDDLDALQVFPESNIVNGVTSFSILHLDDPESAFSQFPCCDTEDVQTLAPHGQASLQGLRTSCAHSWVNVQPGSYPQVTSLDLHVFDAFDLKAAMRACPRLRTLTLHISGNVDDGALTPQDVPSELSKVSISGMFVDNTCAQTIVTLTERTQDVKVVCAQFWSGVSALLGDGSLFKFEHIPAEDGTQILQMTDGRNFTRKVVAEITELDAYEWADFYRVIRPSVGHMDLSQKIPLEYLAILADPEAEICPSGDDLTWHNQFLAAMDNH